MDTQKGLNAYRLLLFRILAEHEGDVKTIKAMVTVRRVRTCKLSDPDASPNGHGVKFLLAQNAKFRKIRREICQDEDDIKTCRNRRLKARRELAVILNLDGCPVMA